VDVGEKATLASQRAMREVSATRSQPTWQIAASMRGASNVADLAGVDVFTMPVKVAAAAKKELKPKFADKVANDPAVTVADGARGETIWGIAQADRTFAASVRKHLPQTAEELVERAQAGGVGDLFPRLSDEDKAHIAADGKIPKHSRWAARIAKGELSIETMLNLAGLASFTGDQAALDDRIRGLI
jgi:transaldolase